MLANGAGLGATGRRGRARGGRVDPAPGQKLAFSGPTAFPARDLGMDFLLPPGGGLDILPPTGEEPAGQGPQAEAVATDVETFGPETPVELDPQLDTGGGSPGVDLNALHQAFHAQQQAQQ